MSEKELQAIMARIQQYQEGLISREELKAAIQAICLQWIVEKLTR